MTNTNEAVRVSQRREWNKVNPITVAKECSEAHIAFLIADALGDIRDLQAAQAEQVKALRAARLRLVRIAGRDFDCAPHQHGMAAARHAQVGVHEIEALLARIKGEVE
jgi:hypothetical protein